MKTVILCGGKGTRLGGWGGGLPKPLLPVGPDPLLLHLMRIYAAQGRRAFVLCLGHELQQFVDWWAAPPPEAAGWQVELADTGLETPTGGRIRRVGERLGGGRFLATYGDGLSDVALDRLLAFHEGHGRLATMTAVRPRVNFGVPRLDASSRVLRFDEKPLMEEWVNGGFFVFEPGVLDYLEDGSVLEREPLERLAADGQLMAYRHDGFWSCLDTYKDHLELNERWESGDAPWRVWEGRA